MTCYIKLLLQTIPLAELLKGSTPSHPTPAGQHRLKSATSAIHDSRLCIPNEFSPPCNIVCPEQHRLARYFCLRLASTEKKGVSFDELTQGAASSGLKRSAGDKPGKEKKQALVSVRRRTSMQGKLAKFLMQMMAWRVGRTATWGLLGSAKYSSVPGESPGDRL